MKMAIAALGFLASLTVLDAASATDSRSVPRGGFSVWVQAQQTEYCVCLDANTRGISCKPIASCLGTGECQRVCPPPK